MATPTYVKLEAGPTESRSPDADQVRNELRESLESSRHLLRRSRLLIELTECGAAGSSRNK